MPRKYESHEKYLTPDPRFGSRQVTLFVNCLMVDGKKSTAFKVLNEAMDLVSQKVPNEDPIDVFNAALANVKPMVEVRSKRVGGATLQVPHEVKKSRQQSLAIRWVIDAARSKKGRPMARRLAEEFFDAYNKQGAAVTKRENTHKMAEANKAFAHFAW